jgi:hypothetical protein
MLSDLWWIVDEVTYRASRLDWQQWMTLSLLVLVVGLFSMRGFGSRRDY